MTTLNEIAKAPNEVNPKSRFGRLMTEAKEFSNGVDDYSEGVDALQARIDAVRAKYCK